MKTIKEKFLTYFGTFYQEYWNISDKVLKLKTKTKFKFYIELIITNFNTKNMFEEGEVIKCIGTPIFNYYLRYKDEYHLSFKELTDDLLIIHPEVNEKYLQLLNTTKKDILKNFRNKILRKKLEKKLKNKNFKNKLNKI